MATLANNFEDIPLGAGLDADAVTPIAPDARFLDDIAAAEAQTPLPAETASGEEAARDPGASSTPADAAAQQREAAVGQVLSRWLATAPVRLFEQLLAQPREKLPIFNPVVGPAVVFRHDHVLTCLERTDFFTVDFYAAELERASDDPAKNPSAYRHLLLGTDRDELYRLDDVIVRRAVSRDDEQLLSALCRSAAERCTREAIESGHGEIDVAETLAKLVPLRVVGDYLGVAWSNRGEPSPLPGLRAGDTFPLPEDLQAVYTFTKIRESVVPTGPELFDWVMDAFRNAFGNINPLHPLFRRFRERGIEATERLTAYVHALITAHKARLSRGEPVPDTVLTRLLRMQRQAAAGDASLEQDLARLLGEPIPSGELARRLSDSRIRAHLVAATTGALVNPQESTCQIADCMLRLAEGQYTSAPGSSFEEAGRLARLDETDEEYPASLEKLRRYALEALRLQPQGEVVLRQCAEENDVLGGVRIKKGKPVFVAYAAAMRDPEAVPDPLTFDISRDERLFAYRGDRERAREAPQSRLYLQHGYGRHKCLGRYASEITMRESLRALLRLGTLERRSELQLDAQHLSGKHLRIGFKRA